MCVTELCVSVVGCQHRWYHLVRPCSPSINLATCDKKMGISGWEVKCDECPYCQGNASEAEYKLVGDGPASPVGSLSSLARAHSVSLSAARRDIRLDNITRTDSVTSVGSKSSLVTAESEKNRAMESRLDAYFFPSSDSPYPPALRDDNDDDSGPASPSDTSSSDHASVRQVSISGEPFKVDLLSRVRRRTKRISDIFG